MIIVLEGLKGKNPSAKVTYGGHISQGMTGNSFYSDPAIIALVTALDLATVNLSKANKKGIVSDIVVKANAFDNAVRAIVLSVQGLILNLPDDIAKDMVESANLGWKKQGKPIIADLAAEQGEEALSAKLRKKVTTGKKRVAYVWQISTSIGEGAVWTYCKFSTVASVTVTGLISGTHYYFRVAIVIGETMGDYSHIADIIIK